MHQLTDAARANQYRSKCGDICTACAPNRREIGEKSGPLAQRQA